MRSITEQRIKQLLPRCNTIIRDNNEKIIELYKELEDNDALIREASLHGIRSDGVSGAVSGGSKKDLGDVMQQHLRLIRERGIEIQAEIWHLVEEIDIVKRLWCCFCTLQGSPAQYIRELYIEKRPYKAVEQEAEVSHRSFEQLRKAGLREIRLLYESDLSNKDIILQGRTQREETMNKKEKKEAGEHYGTYEQLRLEL